MPIRFRCSSCNQLMGISRRKAGTVVHCPTCSQPVTVPMQDGEESIKAPLPPTQGAGTAAAPAAGTASAPAAARELFERDDFEALLRGSPAGPAPAVEPQMQTPRSVHAAFPHVPQAPLPPAPPPPPIVAAGPYKVDPWGPPAGGVVLSPARATILTVVVILLLAVAFGSGLIVGRFYL